MKNGSVKVEPPQFLTGWKEIAHFLGKGVRTVQRYERELGLPVRRPAGKTRGSVVAVSEEIDGWVKASPIREEFHLRSAPEEYLNRAEAFQKGIAELAALKEQMAMLRTEVRESAAKLRKSIQMLQGEMLQGEMRQRGRKFPSEIYSQEEHDLLERVASIAVGIRYPKAN